MRASAAAIATRLLVCADFGGVSIGSAHPTWESRAELAGLMIDDSGAPFVKEFELPRLTDADPSGWPDFACYTAHALLIIELKTEPGSHRPGQLAHYDQALSRRFATALDNRPRCREASARRSGGRTEIRYTRERPLRSGSLEARLTGSSVARYSWRTRGEV